MTAISCPVDHSDATCDQCKTQHVGVGWAHVCRPCWDKNEREYQRAYQHGAALGCTRHGRLLDTAGRKPYSKVMTLPHLDEIDAAAARIRQAREAYEAASAGRAADTLPRVPIKPSLAKRLSEYHLETWRQKRDALIAQAVEQGGSLREVGELVGLSHTQVADIAKRARGEQ